MFNPHSVDSLFSFVVKVFDATILQLIFIASFALDFLCQLWLIARCQEFWSLLLSNVKELELWLFNKFKPFTRIGGIGSFIQGH